MIHDVSIYLGSDFWGMLDLGILMDFMFLFVKMFPKSSFVKKKTCRSRNIRQIKLRKFEGKLGSRKKHTELVKDGERQLFFGEDVRFGMQKC